MSGDLREVSVAAFAQTKMVRSAGGTNEVELLMPVVADVLAQAGLTKNEIGFTCSGSSDYLVGGPFSFVGALDAVQRAGPFGPAPAEILSPDGRVYIQWDLRGDVTSVFSDEDARPSILREAPQGTK